MNPPSSQIFVRPGDLLVVLRANWGCWESPKIAGRRYDIKPREVFLCIATKFDDKVTTTSTGCIEQWAYVVGNEITGWILTSGVLNDHLRADNRHEMEGKIL